MNIQEEIQKAIDSKELYAIGEFVFADWQQAFDTYCRVRYHSAP